MPTLSAIYPFMHFNIPIKSSAVHAIRFGSGHKLLICFHGFGEDAEKFLALQPSLSERYRVIAIDLPFHGSTNWQAADEFTRNDLAQIIRFILSREGQEHFSLMGYSLGGKLVLSAILDFAAQLDEVILVAPDGVKENAWYNIAVYPDWGRKLFLRFVQKPDFVFGMARVLHFTGILSDRFFRFLQLQTNTMAKRRQIYDTWMALKNFSVNLTDVKSQLKKSGVHCFVFIGKYDMLITKQTGELFASGLPHCNLIILEKGHNLVTESLNEPLRQALV